MFNNKFNSKIKFKKINNKLNWQNKLILAPYKMSVTTKQNKMMLLLFNNLRLRHKTMINQKFKKMKKKI
jgi:hypothetical protein